MISGKSRGVKTDRESSGPHLLWSGAFQFSGTIEWKANNGTIDKSVSTARISDILSALAALELARVVTRARKRGKEKELEREREMVDHGPGPPYAAHVGCGPD